MTKNQYNKIVAVIKRDATITHYYLDRDGNTCVLGGLALASKFPVKKLKALDGLSIDGKAYRVIRDFREYLTRHFGLSTTQLKQLQRLNDACSETSLRRAILLAQIKRWRTGPKG